jgi:hypothetical protein
LIFPNFSLLHLFLLEWHFAGSKPVAMESEIKAHQAVVLVQQLCREPLASWAEAQVPRCEFADDGLLIHLPGHSLEVSRPKSSVLFAILKEPPLEDTVLESDWRHAQLNVQKSQFSFFCRDRQLIIANETTLADTAIFFFKFGLLAAPITIAYPIQFQASLSSELNRAFTTLCRT